jgi:hypothetical protein
LAAEATVKESLTVQMGVVHEGRLRPFPAVGGIRPDVYVGSCDAPGLLSIFAVPKHGPNAVCGGKARERASFQPSSLVCTSRDLCSNR